MAVTIKVRQNGSYLVEGDDAVVVDWNGQPYEIARRPFALCRCGHSGRKPFCDGSHRTVGFQASEAAVPLAPEAPAPPVAAPTAAPAKPAGS